MGTLFLGVGFCYNLRHRVVVFGAGRYLIGRKNQRSHGIGILEFVFPTLCLSNNAVGVVLQFLAIGSVENSVVPHLSVAGGGRIAFVGFLIPKWQLLDQLQTVAVGTT